MGRINLLDKSIYNRIAAGEVVERPFSVVKELVENSVDAGAEHIIVEIENGGKSYIKVIDDGCGMDAEDLKKAFLPHATSKIKDVDDLDRIMTLGFRGEALASIAAVAKVTATSKMKNNDLGNEITVDNGVMGELTPAPRLVGTTICVENIFENIPARAKFLKSAKSEEADIYNILTRLALANPTIAFTYYVDDKEVLNTSGNNLKETIMEIYGYETLSKCYEIDAIKNGIRISGFIGKPDFAKPNRTYQTVILNGRYVVNGTIQAAIHNAYEHYLMKRKYPFYVIAIDLSPDAVDVNVHPNKTDVRFWDNQVVYSTVYSCVSKVLDGVSEAEEIIVDLPDKRPIAEERKASGEEKNATTGGGSSQRSSSGIGFNGGGSLHCERPYVSVMPDMLSLGENAGRVYEELQKEYEANHKKQTTDIDEIFRENKKYIEETEKKKELLKQSEMSVDADFRLVGQVMTTYLILEKGQEIYFIDQHAAHERLLFDKFTEEFKNGKISEQPLLIPVEIKTNEVETQFLLDKLDYLHEMGMDIIEYDVNEFRIYSVPSTLFGMDAEEFISDAMSDMTLRKTDVPDVIREKLAQKACKAAIKSGKTLSQSEMEVLFAKLKENMALRCPHGRPVAVKITRNEIDKWFKRIV